MIKSIIYLSIQILILSTSLLIAGSVENNGTSADDLRVMSFNIRNSYARDEENSWNLRKELVYKVIQDYAPDVLGLQEVNHKQLGALKKQFPNYGFIGVASDGGTKGQYSAIMYLKSSLNIVDSGDFLISERSERAHV